MTDIRGFWYHDFIPELSYKVVAEKPFDIAPCDFKAGIANCSSSMREI